MLHLIVFAYSLNLNGRTPASKRRDEKLQQQSPPEVMNDDTLSTFEQQQLEHYLNITTSLNDIVDILYIFGCSSTASLGVTSIVILIWMIYTMCASCCNSSSSRGSAEATLSQQYNRRQRRKDFVDPVTI